MEFRQWLSLQTDRTDDVGDLAHQLLDDPISPLWSNRAATYSAFMVYRNQSGKMTKALRSAFSEYSDQRSAVL